MRSDSLAQTDSLDYGKVLFWAGKEKKAKRVLEDIVARGGKHSRSAARELINMEIETRNAAVAEKMMADFRKRYPPGPKNLWTLYDQVESLGGRYTDKNRLDDAIRVYIDELNSLPFDGRHRSFALLSELTNICQQTEKLDICREQLIRCREGLKNGYAQFADTVSYADSTEQAEDMTPKQYESFIRSCDRLLERIDLIGKPAPDIEFIHVYNADSTMTIGSLRGKVVMLDFWTTWCLGCVVGYNELKILHDEYKDRGLEIIGVTSLQGKYTDTETWEVEENLEPEREIEITAEYIKEKGLFWPCGISKESIFHGEYTVDGVPTFVLIDREGRIRMIRSYAGEIEQKRRVIESFL
jgi:thiol-disulfide isomerase/thioredoxin